MQNNFVAIPESAMYKNTILLLSIIVLAGACNPSGYEVGSPDGRLSASVYLIDSGMVYKLFLDDSLVLDESPLGIRLKGKSYDFISGLDIAGSKLSTVRDTFVLTTGKRSQCILHANQLTLDVRNKAGRTMQLIFSASNDGVDGMKGRTWTLLKKELIYLGNTRNLESKG